MNLVLIRHSENQEGQPIGHWPSRYDDEYDDEDDEYDGDDWENELNDFEEAKGGLNIFPLFSL